MAKTIYDSPTITDEIVFNFTTTDASGNALNPYKVDKVIIYFVSREFTSVSETAFTESIGGLDTTFYYTDNAPVQVFGTESSPAWLSTDPGNAIIDKIDVDDSGQTVLGNFQVNWKPELAREGDYFICYTWTPFITATTQTSYDSFFLASDTSQNTAIPTHRTVPGKYVDLLETYLPEMFKTKVANGDLTPDVLSRFHLGLADGFSSIEDLINQLLDLQDANALQEALLPYLSNFFKHKLRSDDSTRWRRQIKRSVPLYKKKGTLAGLTEALDTAGITFKKLTLYWQVMSQSTWQEAFSATSGQTQFSLAKTPIDLSDTQNYELWIRPVGEPDYVSLALDYVSFTTDDNGNPILIWLGAAHSPDPITLHNGDFVKVLYKIAAVQDQSIENYIRSLSLADDRDETTVTHPLKNWNIRLIAEDDTMFSVIIPTRHPFAFPVVWGKVRTEMVYSEKIYNMDEFNGSIRDSNEPCDIDKTFLDTCSGGRSSKFSLDVEIDSITDDRVVETEEIVREFVPFHAQVHAINYTGSFQEYMVPPQEEITILVDMDLNENIFVGQSDFNRVIPFLGSNSGQFLRNQLATGVDAADTTATGYNSELVLSCPDVFFDAIGVKDDLNLLEILSGTNTGKYTVYGPDTNFVGINQGSPDTIAFPLDTTSFTFRLSNKLYDDAAASIYQDNLFLFSDSTETLLDYTILTTINSSTPWSIVITSGLYAGTYTIYDVFPDGSLQLSGWSGTSNVSSLYYQMIDNLSNVIVDHSTLPTGSLKFSYRGRLETNNLVDDWGIKIGDYVRYSNVDYPITGFLTHSKAYIDGFNVGTVSGISITIYRRLVDNAVGQVDFRGMYLVTATNYESFLNIQDGSNPPLTQYEDNAFMGNFLIQIGSDYYQISSWNGTRIDIVGDMQRWGLSGTAGVSITIWQYFKTSQVSIGDKIFDRIDRRGEEPITIVDEVSPGGMAMGNGITESVRHQESVQFEILWEDGTTTTGEF